MRRARRVGDRIREEISDMILRKIKDPRIGMVTITEVEMSENLRLAKVYYSVIGDESERKRAESGLHSASGFIRRELGCRLRLRHVPEIVFHYDRSMEYGSRMEKIFKELKNGEGD